MSFGLIVCTEITCTAGYVYVANHLHQLRERFPSGLYRTGCKRPSWRLCIHNGRWLWDVMAWSFAECVSDRTAGLCLSHCCCYL